MAKKDKRSLIGYDPLAWMQEQATVAPHENIEKETQIVATQVEVDVAETSIIEVANEGAYKLKLQATQTIQNVSQLHTQLLAMVNNVEKNIEIDASAVNVVDTATLQLIVVLKHEMQRLNRELVVDFPSDKFIEATNLLGLSRYLGTDSVASGFF